VRASAFRMQDIGGYLFTRVGLFRQKLGGNSEEDNFENK